MYAVHAFGALLPCLLHEGRFCCHQGDVQIPTGQREAPQGSAQFPDGNGLWWPGTNNLAITIFSHRGVSQRANHISIAEGFRSLM